MFINFFSVKVYDIMMMSDSFVAVVLLAFTAFYVKQHTAEVETVTSTFDNREYLVRSLPNKQQAANLIAQVNKRLQILVKHVSEETTEADPEDVGRLVRNFDPDAISEGTEKSNYTSYSINKGEKIVFCVRSKEDNLKLIDINTLTYVAIHELGHLMTKEIGHPPEFWDNFKFLLREAVKIGLYDKVDYSKNPVKYCGMKIKSSIIH